MKSLWAAALLLAGPAAAADFGTTLPYVEMRRAGQDWRAALDSADELGLKTLRVGAYWSEIERFPGRFDFTELDDVLERAGAKGYRVILTVGMKAPVWPEYYIPAWALPKHQERDAEISKDKTLRARTLRFVWATVKHVADRSCIEAWQIENEPMDRAGEQRWFIGADFVALEARLVRGADRNGRPLIVNVWADDQTLSSAPWNDPVYAASNALSIGDILGVDVYPRVDDEVASDARTDFFPSEYRAAARARRKDAWIIESQAEDWGKAKLTPDDVRWLVGKQLEQGYDTILLWGFKSWYERKLAGDSALWDAVKELSHPPHFRTLAAK